MAYEYLNTRLRYIKAKRLGPEQFSSYLGMRDLEEFTGALAETDYAREIEEASVEYSGYELVEHAIVRHTRRVYSKMYNMAFDEPEVLIRILLERFEVFNLKTILRGFHVGSDADTIRRSLFPTILYPTSFYEDMLEREEISAIIDGLLTVGNRYYRPLSRVYPEYEASGKLALLELALDRRYFEGSRTLLRDLGSPNADYVRRMLGTEVDILNLVYALRVLDAAVESEERYGYILEGGERLDEEEIRALLNSPDRASFVRGVEATYYGRRLGEISEEIDTNEFQERLETLLYREVCHFEAGRMFDIDMAATLIGRINVEATNLRVIASGLWRGAPREEIERRLIWIEGITPKRAEVA